MFREALRDFIDVFIVNAAGLVGTAILGLAIYAGLGAVGRGISEAGFFNGQTYVNAVRAQDESLLRQLHQAAEKSTERG